jgi:uncharacterized protein YggE
MRLPTHYRLSSLIPLAILTITCHTCAAQNNDSPGRAPLGIVVVGECLSKVSQDRGSVTLASSILAPAPKEASEKAVRAHEGIKRAVRDLALPDFTSETANYSVQQECLYPEGRRTCRGYRAHLATRFETSDIARLGDIIGVASQMSSEEVSDLNTFASPERLKSVREACLETAMRNAATKAQKLAGGAGVKLGKLLSVREGVVDGAVGPMPTMRHFEGAVMAEASSSAPSVDAKPIDLRVEITAQYAIE